MITFCLMGKRGKLWCTLRRQGSRGKQGFEVILLCHDVWIFLVCFFDTNVYGKDTKKQKHGLIGLYFFDDVLKVHV